MEVEVDGALRYFESLVEVEARASVEKKLTCRVNFFVEFEYNADILPNIQT